MKKRQLERRVRCKINLLLNMWDYLYPKSLTPNRRTINFRQRQFDMKYKHLIEGKPSHYCNGKPIYYTIEMLDKDIEKIVPKYIESKTKQKEADHEFLKGFLGEDLYKRFCI